MTLVPQTRKDMLRAALVIAAAPFVLVVVARYIASVSYSSAPPLSEEYFLGRTILRSIQDGACAPIAIGSAILTAIHSVLCIRRHRDLAGWGFVVLAVFGFIACMPTVLRQG